MLESAQKMPTSLNPKIVFELSRNDILRLSRQVLTDENTIDMYLEIWKESFEAFEASILGQLHTLIRNPNETYCNGPLSPHQMSRLCRVLDKHLGGL